MIKSFISQKAQVTLPAEEYYELLESCSSLTKKVEQSVPGVNVKVEVATWKDGQPQYLKLDLAMSPEIKSAVLDQVILALETDVQKAELCYERKYKAFNVVDGSFSDYAWSNSAEYVRLDTEERFNTLMQCFEPVEYVEEQEDKKDGEE